MTAIVDWEVATRRKSGLGALVALVVLVIAAFAVQALVPADTAPTVLYGLIALVLLVLVFLVLLLVLKPKVAQPEAMAEETREQGSTVEAVPEPSTEAVTETAVEAPTAPTTGGGILTLKCGECGTIFDVNDTGERPLYHTCPGCGAEGVLR